MSPSGSTPQRLGLTLEFQYEDFYAGIRAGMTLTGLNGRAVEGRDLALVGAQHQDQEPGTAVEMIFDGTLHAKITLVNYL
jgi:hypothetical protein